MKTNRLTQEEINKIISDIDKKYDKFIGKHNNCYLKALELVKLGQKAEDAPESKQCYKLALSCYKQAIDLAHEDSSPKEALYLMKRSDLYNSMGESIKAAKDIVTASTLDVTELEQVHQDYIGDIRNDLVKLQNIRKELQQLKDQGEIDYALADLLIKLEEVTANNTALLAIHDKTIKKHDDSIASLEVDVTTLRQDINHAVQLLGSSIDKRAKISQDQIDQINNLRDKLQQQGIELGKKVSRSELELYVFRVSEEILGNPKLKDYYDAIYDKLHSKFMEAIVVCGEYVAIDASKIVVKVGTAGINALISLATGMRIPVGDLMNAGAETSVKYKIKEQAEQVKATALNPSDRENIIKQLAQQITLKNAERITQVTQEHQEIKAWEQRSVIETIKDKFSFNVDAKTYGKNLQQSLGCIDALKIVWAITKGLINGSTEEVTDQLLEIPTNYTFTVEKKIPILSEKIWSKIKMVSVARENQLLHMDEIDIIEEGGSAVLSDTVAPATSTTEVPPLATQENYDDDVSTSGSSMDLT